MNRTATILGTSALAAATTCTVVVAGGSPAGAATTCTAYASMPRTVTVHARTPTTLRMTLHGSAGCHASGFDNGATAYLVGPSGSSTIYQRWDRIGDTETVTLYGSLNRTGTYRLTRGNVQVYDANSVRIPARWTTTTVRVRAGH